MSGRAVASRERSVVTYAAPTDQKVMGRRLLPPICPETLIDGGFGRDMAIRLKIHAILHLPRSARRESGGRGIRTHDEVAPIAVFKTAAIGH